MQNFIAGGYIMKFRQIIICMQPYAYCTFLFLLFTLKLYSQTTPIINSRLSGKVTDAGTKEVIPGAVVRIKGTTHVVSTDADGRFEFVTGQKFPYTLIVSYVGYEKTEVVAGGESITVSLKASASSLDEVVVVGYGTQQKANLTGAVATLDFKDIENSPQSSTINLLSGRLPGVAVVQGGGQPGNDDGEITIRGTTGLNGSSIAPLVIIDGIQSTPRDLANLAPQEIDNVTVLKDAASASIYGSRGGNGVILVTTKLQKKVLEIYSSGIANLLRANGMYV